MLSITTFLMVYASLYVVCVSIYIGYNYHGGICIWFWSKSDICRAWVHFIFVSGCYILKPSIPVLCLIIDKDVAWIKQENDRSLKISTGFKPTTPNSKGRHSSTEPPVVVKYYCEPKRLNIYWKYWIFWWVFMQ